MTVSSMFDLAMMNAITTGAGTITLGSAVAPYLSFAGAGVTDGLTVSYIIIDGTNSETGTGVYTSSGTTLTRSVRKSTNSNAAISLSGAAVVALTIAAEDIRPPTDYEVPTTGGSVALSAAMTILDPAADLAALTLAMPTTPFNEQVIRVSCTHNIAALTITLGGKSMKNAATFMQADLPFSYRYRTSDTTWYTT